MRIVFATIALVLGGGCGGGTGVAPAGGWLVGIALGGRPICPTPAVTRIRCHSGPRPLARVVLTGATLHREVRADGSGRFRVHLPPGRYAVSLGASRRVSVRVRSGRVTRVRVGGVGGR
jgi:hypothetical protein